MAQKKITDLQLRSSVTGDLNFPSDDTIQSYRVTAAQIYDYIRGLLYPESTEVSNLTIATSVSSSALTIALKTLAGTNPSSTDYIRVGFRNATLTSGSFSIKTITSATSLVISSGSTLGQVSGQPARIWVYLIDAGSSPELAVSGKRFRDNEIVSTTAEGGAGAADSHSTLYSTTSRSSVAIKCIGYIDNTQTTAGTWASAGTQIQLITANVRTSPTVQSFASGSGTYYKPAGCTRIKVRVVGGGAGGGGGGSPASDAATQGTDGNSSSFGPCTAAGGSKGRNSAYVTGGGAGGTVTLTTSSTVINVVSLTGGQGQGPNHQNTNNLYFAGSPGGANPMGGAGQGLYNGGGQNGTVNTGAGGGGGCGNGTAANQYGAGGGAGAYCEFIILNPDASYSYSVGAVANGGGAGSNGYAGGAGGSGVVIVEEFYD